MAPAGSFLIGKHRLRCDSRGDYIHLQLCLIKCELDILVFDFENCLFVIVVSLQK